MVLVLDCNTITTVFEMIGSHLPLETLYSLVKTKHETTPDVMVFLAREDKSDIVANLKSWDVAEV